MFGTYLNGAEGLIIISFAYGSELANPVSQGHKEISLIDGGIAVASSQDTFEPHACIDIGFRQRRAFAILVLVELRENKVPNLREAPAATGRVAARFATAVFLPKIIMYLAAGSAGTAIACRAPKVVPFSQSYDPFLRKTCFTPDLESFIIIKKYGDPEPVFG